MFAATRWIIKVSNLVNICLSLINTIYYLRKTATYLNLHRTIEIYITFLEWFTLRAFVTSSLFIRDRTQTTRSLLHSNFEVARWSRRPIEREENKSGKIFSISKEKALGNFIQTDGRVAGGKIVWQKVKSLWFRGSGYFSVERGKSESLTRAPFIFRRDPPRGKDAWSEKRASS